MVKLDSFGVPPTQSFAFADVPLLMTEMTGDGKHENAAASTLDVLWVLYDGILNVSPSNMSDENRDRFYLSKGHGPMAYYATLAAKGFFPPEWLKGWTTYQSPLGYHPDRNLLPGVEISSGSLGHGLPLAVGTAIGLRAQRIRARVIVLVGDGELEEGSNHEAVEFAGAIRLAGLTVVLVDNQSATYARVDLIDNLFALNNWNTNVVDGRDHLALESALTDQAPDRPNLVIAKIDPSS